MNGRAHSLVVYDRLITARVTISITMNYDSKCQNYDELRTVLREITISITMDYDNYGQNYDSS